MLSVEAVARSPLPSSSETVTVDPAFPPGAMFAVGGVVKTSWVGTGSGAVPRRAMVCVALVVFRLLSVRTTEPLVLPAAVGVKSTASVQDAPEASVEVEDDVLNCGHVVAVFSAKPIEMLGFVPIVGVTRVSALLPMFEIVAVCGPSVVSVDPTLVAVAKP